MTTEHIESGSFAANAFESLERSLLRVVSWNINRGRCFDEILRFLTSVDADLILLQECDLNAVRSGSRNVARDLAKELRLNYVFGVEFEELSQGNGNGPAFHGQATLSRMPLTEGRIFRFHAQSSYWSPRWFLPNIRPMQRRLGGRMALITHVTVNQTRLVVYNVHLESRNGDDLRLHQIREVLEDAVQHHAHAPVIVGGDFNCDVTEPAFAVPVEEHRLRNPFASEALETPDPHRSSRPIDWILVGGPVYTVSRSVHELAPGSDHSPRSLVLRLA